MRIIAALVVLLAILALILGPQAFFVVDETQLAVVTRFGNPIEEVKSPGLKTKTPFIDTVTYFDRRLLVFDAPVDALLTRDKKRLLIDVYGRGRIVEPLTFFRTVNNQERAAARVGDIIASELRREIALDDQLDVIATNREAIMNRVRDAAAPTVRQFGIELLDVRIMRADFPKEIAESIYARMQAERQRIANAERAEGAKQDLELRAEVDRQATVIRAEAERDANITKGQGEAEAIRIFAEALQQDPQFYTFQRSLEAYRKFLATNTTVVLPATSDLFAFLQSPMGNGKGGVLDGSEPPQPIVSPEFIASIFLASKLGVDRAELKLVRSEAVDWPDSSLGCPEPGKVYTQAIVPGYRIIFDHNGQQYEVHSNRDGSRLASC